MQESKTIAFFNGEFLPLEQVRISPDDRGFLFGDAVYEVIRIYDGKPFLIEEHLARLKSSLRLTKIPCELEFQKIIEKNIELNKIVDGYIYLQVSRGVAPRNHGFFGLNIKPTILLYSKPFEQHPFEELSKIGIKVKSCVDDRWAHCNIKSTNLLANCLALNEAQEKNCQDVIFFNRENFLTEASAANVFVVKDETCFTPKLSQNILPGVTRNFIFAQAGNMQIKVLEKPISKEQVISADEVFLTSSTKEAIGVIAVDESKISNGKVGPVTQKIRKFILSQALGHLG